MSRSIGAIQSVVVAAKGTQRAKAPNTSHQQGILSIIPQCTATAEVTIWDTLGAQFRFDAAYIGRGLSRDAYEIIGTNMAIKLEQSTTNMIASNCYTEGTRLRNLAFRSVIGHCMPKVYHCGKALAFGLPVICIIMDKTISTLDVELALVDTVSKEQAVRYGFAAFREAAFMYLDTWEKGIALRDAHAANLGVKTTIQAYTERNEIGLMMIDAEAVEYTKNTHPDDFAVHGRLIIDDFLRFFDHVMSDVRGAGNLKFEVASLPRRCFQEQPDLSPLQRAAFLQRQLDDISAKVYDLLRGGVASAVAPTVASLVSEPFTEPDWDASDEEPWITETVAAAASSAPRAMQQDGTSRGGRISPYAKSAAASAALSAPGHWHRGDTLPHGAAAAAAAAAPSSAPAGAASSARAPWHQGDTVPIGAAAAAASAAPSSAAAGGGSDRGHPAPRWTTKSTMDRNEPVNTQVMLAGQRFVLGLGSEFRGVGRLGRRQEGRVSFEERSRTGEWVHVPQMTPHELDHISLIGELMFSGLREVFARLPMNKYGKPQQRTVDYSKFTKHGFMPRLYGWIHERRGPLSGYDHPADWITSVDVMDAVMKEMHVLRKGEGENAAARIRCFQFRDEYECCMIVRAVASAYLRLLPSMVRRRQDPGSAAWDDDIRVVTLRG